MAGVINENSLRQMNTKILAAEDDCILLIQEMQRVEKLMGDFGFLSLGRDIILCGKWSFSLQRLITSIELTAGSIISCCESACIADANSLLRKYRDDLLFYLYIVVFDAYNKLENDCVEAEKMKQKIERWAENNLANLKTGEVLKAIGSFPKVLEAVKKYNLETYFSKLGNRLNNYVHSNGYAYYNLNINVYQGDELSIQLRAILHDMRYVTISFLFLLTLCSPHSIMSIDYIDCLDCNITPSEGAQYWVAPFVEKFIRENLNLIDKSCLDYLRDKTTMRL